MRETLDLFRDFTRKEVDILVSIGEGRGSNQEWRRNLTEEEREERTRIRLAKTFHRPDVIARSRATQKESWARMAPEGKTDRINKTLRCDAAQEGIREYWEGKSLEERKLITRKANEAVRNDPSFGPRMSRLLKRKLASMTVEEMRIRMDNSLNSEEAILKRSKSNRELPTQPEVLVGLLLGRLVPELFGYNGNGNLHICIGKRVPDYVRLDGPKQVISVMGGLGYHHFLEDEDSEIQHYKKFGYDCIVIWEFDIYSEETEDKILKFVGGSL